MFTTLATRDGTRIAVNLSRGVLRVLIPETLRVAGRVPRGHPTMQAETRYQADVDGDGKSELVAYRDRYMPREARSR